MKFITQSEYAPKKGRVFTQPSLTVPNESYTIRELIQRASRGMETIDTRFQIGNDDTFDSMTYNDTSDNFDLMRRIDEQSQHVQDLQSQHNYVDIQQSDPLTPQQDDKTPEAE